MHGNRLSQPGLDGGYDLLLRVLPQSYWNERGVRI